MKNIKRNIILINFVFVLVVILAVWKSFAEDSRSQSVVNYLCGKGEDKFHNVEIRILTQCTDDKGIIFFRGYLNAEDAAYFFYNSKGEFVMRCGGFARPNKEDQEKCDDFERRLTCDFTKDLCTGTAPIW